MEPQLTFTPNAITKIQQILIEAGQPDLALRVFVQGGGCSGFTQGFTLDAEPAAEDDYVAVVADGVRVMIDSMSHQYLAGTSVDYVEELMGAQFVINNPNAVGKCGCGSSFSV